MKRRKTTRRRIGGNPKKFKKVVKGWDRFDSFYLLIYVVGLISSTYLTININPYFVFLSLSLMIACMVGLYVFLEREVYWREIK